MALTLPGELGVFFSWHHVEQQKKPSRPDLSQKDFAGWGLGIPVAVGTFSMCKKWHFLHQKSTENIVCHFLRQLWLGFRGTVDGN